MKGDKFFKRHPCWTCLFARMCKYAEPTCVKCDLQKTYEKYFNGLLKLMKNEK